MTFGGSNFNDFHENQLFQNADFGAFEGTAGTLLVVFKMHGLQQQKTVSV